MHSAFLQFDIFGSKKLQHCYICSHPQHPKFWVNSKKKKKEISWCDSIEEIVSKEGDESHENDKIFQHLNCLKLKELPKLRRVLCH
ncbi:hypothetical protein AAZV13_07G057900 [Glycine max]